MIVEYSDTDFTSLTYIINVDDLTSQITEAGLAVLYINTVNIHSGPPYTVSIFFSGNLSNEERDTLDAVINNYDGIDPEILKTTYCIISDIKSSGTNGGSSVKNAWTIRDLNTITGNTLLFSLQNNTFTIKEPGNYKISIKSVVNGCRNNQLRLYNNTDNSVAAYGLCSFASSGNTLSDSGNDTSLLDYILTISVPKTFEIQHICSKSVNKTGFGLAGGFGEELYTIVIINSL
jgi:hypothetical protein